MEKDIDLSNLSRKNKKLFKKIRVTACPYKAKFTPFYPVNKQPVRFNVAFSAIF
jgi:hypothetical protein